MKILSHLALVILACMLATCTGCRKPPVPKTTTEFSSSNTSSSSFSQHRPRREENAQPGNFDYYILNLSWSPEFCTEHPTNPQCAARPGFIVHGLWPQNNDGTYPENCVGMLKPPNASAYLDLMPDANLIDHEWKAHGTCTAMNPEEYFTAVRSALRSVEIPDTFSVSHEPPPTIAPQVLLAQFSRANPTFPASSFVLSCGNNYLTAVEVCFDKGLRPQPCQGVHSCRANVVKIAPR
jgi:ribonuclease T2